MLVSALLTFGFCNFTTMMHRLGTYHVINARILYAINLDTLALGPITTLGPYGDPFHPTFVICFHADAS